MSTITFEWPDEIPCSVPARELADLLGVPQPDLESLDASEFQSRLDDALHDIADHYGAAAANATDDEDAQEDALDAASDWASDMANGSSLAGIAAVYALHGREGARRTLGLPTTT